MHYPDINYVAVLVAAVAAYLLGGLWYGLLFGKAWTNALGKKMDELGSAKMAMMVSAFIHLILAFAMAVIVGWAAVTGPIGGLLVGLFVGLLVAAMVTGLNDVYEGRSLRLYLITAGHTAAALALMGLVIGFF